MRSPLSIATSINYEAIKANALRDQDILVVSLNDNRLSWADREILKQIGEKVYGRSPEKHHGQRRS